AADEVLRVVGPVAVGADPDLEERRLTLDDRAVRGRREGLDAGTGPDEREPESQLDLASPACAFTVYEPLPGGRNLCLGEPDTDETAYVLGGGGCDLVREPDPLDLLTGLARARVVEDRRRIDRAGEGIEPAFREGRRLADHAVGCLR